MLPGEQIDCRYARVNVKRLIRKLLQTADKK